MNVDKVITDFKGKVDAICGSHYTTNEWKNGWSYEVDGNKVVTEKGRYLFLIEEGFKYGLENSFLYKDVGNLEVSLQPCDIMNIKGIRVDIELGNNMLDVDEYFYVTNEVSWGATEIYLLDLIKTSSEYLINMKEKCRKVIVSPYRNNPSFLLEYSRDIKLGKLGI